MAIPTPDFLSMIPMYRPNPANPIGDALGRIGDRQDRAAALEEQKRSSMADEQLRGRQVGVSEGQLGINQKDFATQLKGRALEMWRSGHVEQSAQLLEAAGEQVPDWWRQGPPPEEAYANDAPTALGGLGAPFSGLSGPEAVDSIGLTEAPAGEQGPPSPPEPGTPEAAPPAPELPGMPDVPELPPTLGMGMQRSQRPSARASQTPADRMRADIAGEDAAIARMFEGGAAAGNATAQQMLGLAPGYMDAMRRGGKGSGDAAEDLLGRYAQLEGGQVRADTSLAVQDKRNEAKKGKGGGGGTPTWNGIGNKRRLAVMNYVRGITKDTAAFAKVPAFRETLNTSRQLKQLLSSADPLADRAAFARILQQLFKGATSDRELGFLESAGGLENRVATEWNKWASEGRLPEDFIRSAMALADQGIGTAEGRLNQDGAALEGVVRKAVETIEPGVDPGEIPNIARNLLLGASVESGSGATEDPPLPPEYE
jgi:hypothetical protein